MSAWRRRWLPVLAVVTAIGLMGAACGSDGTSSASAGSTAADAGSSTSGNGDPANGETMLEASLTASGSTFALPFYQEGIAAYRDGQPGVTMSYGGGGSGKGRQDLADQVTDWAGTDSLIKDEEKAEYKGGEVLYFPTIAAPITVSYNVSGVDDLHLSAETIAKIFQMEITNWNDRAIAADNPGAKLPDKQIVVVHRADSSGTTDQFTKFLEAAAPDAWTLGSGSTVNWPANGQAATGNGGMTTIVKSTDGSVGYIDFSDAKAAGLSFAAVKNKAGRFVEPSLEATSAALDGAQLGPDLTYRSVWADGDESYPIALATWLITYKTQTDKAKGEAIRSWLRFLYTDGQKLAPDLDYAPLPASFVEKAEAQIDEIVVPA